MHFVTMLSISSKANQFISTKVKLLSANALNLGMSTILSGGQEKMQEYPTQDWIMMRRNQTV